MFGFPNKVASSRLADAATRYGFQQVHHVHVELHDDGDATAVVIGTSHRYPRTVAVPLGVANDLVAAGAPVTISDRGEG